MGRVVFRKDFDPPVFRKIAFGTWKNAADPTVYGIMEIDMTKASAFAERYSKEQGIKITPTHLVALATAHCMVKRPEINGMIRLGKIHLRQHVALSFLVNIPGQGKDRVGKADVSSVTIHKVEELKLMDIAKRLTRDAGLVKERKDPAMKKSFQTVNRLPWSWVHNFLNLTTWLLYDLNLDLTKFGLPSDPFGSAIITNVGGGMGAGIDMAWAPLCPYTRTPLLLTLSSVREKAVVIDGQVVARPILSIGVTFDHRFMDGAHAAQMSSEFKKCFDEPEKYFV